MTTATILALPEFSTEWNPQVGDIVSNFGIPARIIEFHSEPGLVILREIGGKDKWLADIKKCQPVL